MAEQAVEEASLPFLNQLDTNATTDAAVFSARLNELTPGERALISNVYNRLRLQYPEKSDVEMLEMTAEWTGCLHEARRGTGNSQEEGIKEDTDSPRIFEVHPSGKPYRRGEKTLIMNVYSQLRHRNQDKSETEIVAMTAMLTGCGSNRAFKIKGEFRRYGGPLPTANKQRPGAVGKRVRLSVYDEFVLSGIRKKVHNFYRENVIANSDKICAAINADPKLPDFKPRTLRRLLSDLGFHTSIRSRNSHFVERDDIILNRRRYLRQIRQFRAEEKPIYYVDETWVSVNQGLDNAVKMPSGKGRRLIVLHAGCDSGLVNRAETIFKCEKTGELVDEIDGPRFEEWFKTQLLPNLKPGSVIVMDSAPCHAVELEQLPTSATRKPDIQAWLTDRGVSWSADMIKRELLAAVSKVKGQHVRYRVDAMAELNGHKVLHLPQYHCELNPMELVWTQIKDHVAKENKVFEITTLEELIKHAFVFITAEKWSKCMSQILEEEQRLWEVDELDDLQVEHVARNANGNDNSSEYNGVEASEFEEFLKFCAS